MSLYEGKAILALPFIFLLLLFINFRYELICNIQRVFSKQDRAGLFFNDQHVSLGFTHFLRKVYDCFSYIIDQIRSYLVELLIVLVL